MQARCPYCSQLFDAASGGVQACTHCGAQVNVPVPEAAGAGAKCAVHPDRGAAGTCPRCGNFACAECNQGQSGGPCPACRALGVQGRGPTPWERRAELGVLQGLWQTWKSTMFKPEEFWRSLQPDGKLSDALLYGWVVTLVAGLFQMLMNLLNFGSVKSQMEQLTRSGAGMPPEATQIFNALTEHWVAFSVGLFVFTVVIYPLSWVIGAAFVHLGCLVFGASKNGFNATARVVGYAVAPNALAWVPVVGGLVGLYTLALEVWGIARAQETTVGRAIGAVLFIVVLVTCCACAGAIMVGVAAAGKMR